MKAKNPIGSVVMGIMVFGAITMSACTQMPTETSGIADLRPQISFRTGEGVEQSSRVLVDGLDMGSVGDFLDGKAALRVLPGTHHVAVQVVGRGTVVDEKVYLGDGVSRSFLVK